MSDSLPRLEDYTISSDWGWQVGGFQGLICLYLFYSLSRKAFLWEISLFFIVYLYFKVLLYCLFVLPLSTLFKILINILYQPCSQRPFRIPESVFLASFITWKEPVGDLWKTIIWNFNFLRNILRKQNLRKISRLYVTKIVSRAKVIALLMRASRAWTYSLSLPFPVSLPNTQTPKHKNTQLANRDIQVKWQDK